MKCFSCGRMTRSNDLVYDTMIGPRKAYNILNQSKRRLCSPSQSDTRPRSLAYLVPHLSPSQRLKGCFSVGEDTLSNVSAGKGNV